MDGFKVITSSLCPPDTAYLLSDPPQRDMFDSDSDYAQAVVEWQRVGAYAVKGLWA